MVRIAVGEGVTTPVPPVFERPRQVLGGLGRVLGRSGASEGGHSELGGARVISVPLEVGEHRRVIGERIGVGVGVGVLGPRRQPALVVAKVGEQRRVQLAREAARPRQRVGRDRRQAADAVDVVVRELCAGTGRRVLLAVERDADGDPAKEAGRAHAEHRAGAVVERRRDGGGDGGGGLCGRTEAAAVVMAAAEVVALELEHEAAAVGRDVGQHARDGGRRHVPEGGDVVGPLLAVESDADGDLARRATPRRRCAAQHVARRRRLHLDRAEAAAWVARAGLSAAVDDDGTHGDVRTAADGADVRDDRRGGAHVGMVHKGDAAAGGELLSVGGHLERHHERQPSE